MSTATLKRETLKTSRLMDFLSAEELVKQTGTTGTTGQP